MTTPGNEYHTQAEMKAENRAQGRHHLVGHHRPRSDRNALSRRWGSSSSYGGVLALGIRAELAFPGLRTCPERTPGSSPCTARSCCCSYRCSPGLPARSCRCRSVRPTWRSAAEHAVVLVVAQFRWALITISRLLVARPGTASFRLVRVLPR